MKGKIIKGIAGFYYVNVVESGLYECKAKGSFRKNGIKPLVGDEVELEVLDEEEKIGNVTKILPRKNELIRPAVANIDQALVVFAVTEPKPHYNLLDRFLVMMERKEIPVILCFNKTDLAEHPEIAELEEVYASCGYPVLFTSAKKEENIEKMMAFIKEVKEKYNLDKNNTEIYATGIWRKIPNEQLANIEARFNELDLEFNVISHDKENYYFEKAMQGTYNNRVMMVNMGGKTTELVIFDNDTVENRVNLTVGVSDVFDKYPNINELDSGISKEEVINYLENLISEDINFNCDIAIHTGGELRFQKLVKYNLQPNKFFDDGIHKVYVTYEDFDKKNEELLNKTTLDELRSLMPTNPDWMNGAKAGIMLGEAIFRKANIKNIIPSDLNLINGVIKEK